MSAQTTPKAGDHLRARLSSLRESAAYHNYLLVRDRVLEMKEYGEAQLGEDAGPPSKYWEEELAWFDYMLDASPLIVERLRWHTHHVTGIKAYDYRTHKDAEPLSRKLEALIEEAGRDLFVPENPSLGGFGFETDEGELFNVDTLKFMEVFAALDQGAVLDEFRGTIPERRLVWEIGAGWGGFAYQWKTLCPNTTYLIVDLPELFLFSATYLQTLFPDARVRFYTERSDDELFDGWEGLDFIFVPHTRLDRVRPPRLDLTINMVSFQEMTTQQVRAYVHHAADQGSPYLYSLNRERSLYNPELTGVRAILGERFWPHEIEVLPVSYVRMLDGGLKSRSHRAKQRAKDIQRKAKGKRLGKPDLDYKHLIGWRRLCR